MEKKDLIPQGESKFTPQNIAKVAVLAVVAGFAVWAFGTFVLPFLVSFAWNVVSLAIACIIAAPLLLMITSSRFWRTLWYLNEALTKVMLFWLMEFDEFAIQRAQIADAEDEVENFIKEREKLVGVKIKLSKMLTEKQGFYNDMLGAYRSAKNNNDEENAELLLLKANAHKMYIEAVEPTVNDLTNIAEFSEKIIKDAKRKIDALKTELETVEDIYTAVKAGSSAMQSALKTIFGDKDINSDAEMAKNRVKMKISNMAGQISVSMKELKEFKTLKDYEDRGKVEALKNTLLNVSIDDQGEAQTINYQVKQTQTHSLLSGNHVKGILD